MGTQDHGMGEGGESEDTEVSVLVFSWGGRRILGSICGYDRWGDGYVGTSSSRGIHIPQPPWIGYLSPSLARGLGSRLTYCSKTEVLLRV